MKSSNFQFQSILKKIKTFRDERDWKQFHNPKDMAEAIVIEASELLELFLWKSKKEAEEFMKDEKNREEFSDELADITWFIIELADTYNIDIEQAIENKLKKNAKKYPIEKSKGKTTKWTKL